MCGCGTPDVDSDGDGVVDCNDGCPHDSQKTTAPGDGDCLCGGGTSTSSDVDGDGTPDCVDPCPHTVEEACPDVCPGGWLYANGRCWRVSTTLDLFAAFVGDGNCMGGTLASIFSDEDNMIARNVCSLYGFGQFCLIGYVHGCGTRPSANEHVCDAAVAWLGV